MRLRWWAVSISIVGIALPAAASPTEVKLSGNLVDVRTSASPLAEVLDSLARHTGMKVVYEGPPPRTLVSATIEHATPIEATTRLLEGMGLTYAAITDNAGHKVVTLLVITSNSTGSGSGSAPPPLPMPAPAYSPAPLSKNYDPPPSDPASVRHGPPPGDDEEEDEADVSDEEEEDADDEEEVKAPAPAPGVTVKPAVPAPILFPGVPAAPGVAPVMPGSAPPVTQPPKN